MDRLGRHTLSVILSFLTETEGASLLICRKAWANSILPVFRLPSKGGPSKKQHRHRFIVYPVPDASTRLERLNTKRWFHRWKKHRRGDCSTIQRYCNLSMKELALREWKQSLSHQRREDDGGNDTELSDYDGSPLLQFWSKHLERSLLSGIDNGTLVQPSALFRPGTTLLASYPRSGNTLVRSLLESVTGFVTSSDTRADRPLSRALAEQHGLVGEGRTQDPICKSHWPERVGCQPYRAARVILLVRNPWDAIDSYWHLNLTNTHTEKVTDQAYRDHQEFFQHLVRNELSVWLEFLDFYWKRKDVPVLLVRYEDLILDRKKEMERMLEFCTTSDWWRPRLDALVGGNGTKVRQQHGYQSSTSSVSSSSASPTSSIGRSLVREVYSTLLLQELHAMMDILDGNGWLERLGYHVQRQDFPKNIMCLPELPVRQGSDDKQCAFMAINQPLSNELRSQDSPFGRNMRQWRRQHTNDDTSPFPTV